MDKICFFNAILRPLPARTKKLGGIRLRRMPPVDSNDERTLWGRNALICLWQTARHLETYRLNTLKGDFRSYGPDSHPCRTRDFQIDRPPLFICLVQRSCG
jgi:hypothetical protein